MTFKKVTHISEWNRLVHEGELTNYEYHTWKPSAIIGTLLMAEVEIYNLKKKIKEAKK